MALPWDKKEFQSWHEALLQGRLTQKQRKLLEEMVADGQASTVEQAARMLDWQEAVVNPEEHMYGA